MGLILVVAEYKVGDDKDDDFELEEEDEDEGAEDAVILEENPKP